MDCPTNSQWAGEHHNRNTIYVGETPNSISFSGCGFLGVYHIGVASCLKEHAPKWVNNLDRVYGCSAGSIVGAMLLSDVCFGEVCKHTMDIVVDARSHLLGPFSPRFKLYKTLLKGFREGLPEDAHIKTNGKLFVSLTRVCDLQNVIVSEYETREELIQVLMCSSFVPFYSGLFPPKYRGVRYVDGGITNNLPSDVDTITVSPWSGSSDICPQNDESTSLIDLSFVNQSIQMTASNIYRLSRMFFPSHPEVLEDFCKQGFRETIQYLRDHGLFETVQPLRRNLSFSAKLHKVEERRRMTRRLSYSARCLHEKDLEDKDITISGEEKKNQLSQSLEECDFNCESNTISLEECFEEDENDLNDLASTKSKHLGTLDVLTVIHVYPIEKDHELRVQLQLPAPVLEALEAALDNSTLTWKRPLAKILSTCRQSFVFRIPLEKTYSTACFLLQHAEMFPQDAKWLVTHLKQLVYKLQCYFKCAEQLLTEKLRNCGEKARKEIAVIAENMNIVIQLLLQTLMERGFPFYPTWLLRRDAKKTICASTSTSFDPTVSPYLQMISAS